MKWNGDFIIYVKNVLFRSTATKLFLCDLLCPSDWKLHYLSIFTREIRYSASRNADPLKWVLLLPVPNLDLEMGEHTAGLAVGRVCSRETPAGFWGMEARCFRTQLRCSSWRSSFDAEEVEPERSDACSFNMGIKGCFPQYSHFYCWNMTLQIIGLWRLEPLSHVRERVPGRTLQGCVRCHSPRPLVQGCPPTLSSPLL